MRLAVKHGFIGSQGGGGVPPLHRADRFAVPASPRDAPGPRCRVALAITIAVHAAIGFALWYATGRAAVEPPPQRIEVALIAPPQRIEPPPPPPPPVRRRMPVTERAPVPTPVPQLEATPIELPRLAAPQPLTIPVPAVVTPLQSPITAVPAAIPSPAIESPAPPKPAAEPALLPPRFDAAYLENPPPAYPPAARRAREQGRVLLRVLVAADGRALTVDLAKSSGSALLDQAALDAVRRWRFVPARRGDVAVQAHVQVPIVFSLIR